MKHAAVAPDPAAPAGPAAVDRTAPAAPERAGALTPGGLTPEPAGEPTPGGLAPDEPEVEGEPDAEVETDEGAGGAQSGDTPTLLEPGGQNAVGVTLGLIGDEWTLLILRYAAAGVRRYNDWMEQLPISNSVLTNRLTKLAEFGLLEKVRYQDRPARYEYRLTKRGRDAWPILLSIWSWEASWVEHHDERLPTMRHRRCGQDFQPVLLCYACRKPVEPRDVTGGFGPSGAWERSVPSANTRRRSGPATVAAPGHFPQTMALIGNRWSSALLGAAFLGAHRFKDFEQQLGAPPTMVADRLRTFCELGVLAPAPGLTRPDWMSYHLTAKGRAFFPVVMCTIDWGHRWFKAPEGRALVYRHTDCRRIFTPRLACGQCGEVLRGNDVTINLGLDRG